jgi:hypothetical protein
MAFRLPPPPTAQQSSHTQQPPILDNNHNLRNSYFNMINNKDNDSAYAAVDPAAPPMVPLPGSTVAPAASSSTSFEQSPFIVDQTDVESFRELLELCGMTPDGTPALGFNDSPMEETPLFTPALDMFSTTPYLDGWDQSPAMGGDQDSFDALPPLFDMAPAKLSNTTRQNENTHTIDDQSQLFTLPQTPALAPAALAPLSGSANNGRKVAGPTGFRKGVTPSAMVPMDAPTQTRQYLSDSKTSRKEIPAAFQNKARKRQRDEALDEDEVPDDIQDAIAAKRRLNTLAARRSRARKAQTALENEERIQGLVDHVTRLQEELVRVSAERDTYKSQLGLI